MSAGRSCPLSYRYGPAVFRQPASIETDVLYVVGVVHGDAESLAGWGFAVETLAGATGQQQARQWFDDAGVVVEAMPISYDIEQAHGSFLRQWPPGSAAYDACWQRFLQGPLFHVDQASRA